MGMQADTVIHGRVVYVSQDQILADGGAWIVESKDGGANWHRLLALPINRRERTLLASRILRRLLRRGVHHIGVESAYTMLIANNAIYGLDSGLIKSLGLVRGSRPLALCTANHTFYYGEYRSNPERSSVHIWKWQVHKKNWEAVWQFTGIRHVHGVFYDPYESAIWLSTGDLDHEVGIWRTDDDFVTLQKIAGGSQQFRAVQLLFDQDHVYFGSDTPDNKNHIFSMNRKGKNLKQLSTVSSSVFYGCKVGSNLFFSTAVEPSRVNTTRHVEVWGSADGGTWTIVRRIKKDIWPMKYFQYGQVLFPAGPGDGKNLWLTPIATENDQKTFKIPVSNIFADSL